MEEVPISFFTLLSIFEFNICTEVIFSFVILIFLLLSSAFISASEVAFFSLTPNEIDEINDRNIFKLLKYPNKLLATILVVNNFINVGIVVLSSYITKKAFIFHGGEFYEFVFQVVIVTSLLLLFGEIMPKVYANNNSANFSLRMSKSLIFLQKVVSPVNNILIKTSKFINNQLTTSKKEISADEISKALDITDHDAKEDEKRILRSIVEFGNTDVKEIMQSRVDIFAIEKSTYFKDVIKNILSSGFSRIPIYSGQIDTIIGILHIKDLIPHLHQDNNFEWVKLCRLPFFVPETKMINDLLKEFQDKKNHLAIVVDEYGGTSGLVSLEDILEEIVGEINDEFDVDDNIYSVLDNNNYIFDAKISIHDFLRIVKIDLDYFDSLKGESDTLAGLVLEIEGKIPKIGKICKIPPFTFTIESSDQRRIKRIKVTIDE